MFSNKSEEECNNVNSCNFIEFENRLWSSSKYDNLLQLVITGSKRRSCGYSGGTSADAGKTRTVLEYH